MERIGFIGLGIMGKPMARNLLKAGYPLIVHNRSQAAVSELAAEGATKTDSPKEVAEQSDIIITMLPDSPDVELVIFGENGISGAVRSGVLFIDMSTIAPATARKVQTALLEKGVDRSEVLAVIALRARKRIVERHRKRVQSNLAVVEDLDLQ